MNLAWIDLETLGTDEHHDPIVEVGCIVTDEHLHVIAEPWEVVVKPAGWPRDCTMNAEVAMMHAASGLLGEIGGGLSIGPVDRTLAGILDHYTVGGTIALAGSGVAHFDGRFIRAQMPETAKRLTYWTIDVGVIRRFATKVCGAQPQEHEAKTHRALEDARLHLDEAIFWREQLGKGWALAEGVTA